MDIKRSANSFGKKQTWRDYVEVSKYTSMEVEQSSNTANTYAMGNSSNLGHFDPNAQG